MMGRNFRGYLFSRVEKKCISRVFIFAINTDSLLISLFYADFDGISEKSTFRGCLISRNSRKLVPAKISTIKVIIQPYLIAAIAFPLVYKQPINSFCVL